MTDNHLLLNRLTELMLLKNKHILELDICLRMTRLEFCKEYSN